MSFREELSNLIYEMNKESDKAHILWTWLPSYRYSRIGHGDLSYNYMPSISDILIEASICFSMLGGYELDIGELQWFDCPCEDLSCKGNISSIANSETINEIIKDIKIYILNRKGQP